MKNKDKVQKIIDNIDEAIKTGLSKKRDKPPFKIFLDCGSMLCSSERVEDSDIEYFHGQQTFPVFDIFEQKLEEGAKIAKQDGEWCLFDKDGEGITSGETIRELMINLIFVEC